MPNKKWQWAQSGQVDFKGNWYTTYEDPKVKDRDTVLIFLYQDDWFTQEVLGFIKLYRD